MLSEAKAMLTEREAAHRRAVELNEQGIAPEREVQTSRALMNAARSRVETLEVAIRDHVVRAPFAGVLGLRRVSVGSLLQSSTVITTLDDLSVVKVDFTIPETWLSAVRVGQPVRARSDAWPGEVFAGEVSAIDTRLDRRTRSATIRAIVDNQALKLRPGMLLKVDVDRGEEPSRQIPEEALVQRGDRHFVYVVGDDAVAAEVEVEVGRRQVGKVEVLAGVQPGQRIVVEGLVRVRDGSEVEVVAVDVGPGGLHRSEYVQVVLVGELRVHPGNHVDLGHGLVELIADLLSHLLGAHDVRALLAGKALEGAEAAELVADVRVVDVLVDVEVGQVSVETLANMVGQLAHHVNVRVVERHPVLEAQALPGDDLLRDLLQAS